MGWSFRAMAMEPLIFNLRSRKACREAWPDGAGMGFRGHCGRADGTSAPARTCKLGGNNLSRLRARLLRVELAHDQLRKVGVGHGESEVGLVGGRPLDQAALAGAQVERPLLAVDVEHNEALGEWGAGQEGKGPGSAMRLTGGRRKGEAQSPGPRGM